MKPKHSLCGHRDVGRQGMDGFMSVQRVSQHRGRGNKSMPTQAQKYKTNTADEGTKPGLTIANTCFHGLSPSKHQVCIYFKTQSKVMMMLS